MTNDDPLTNEGWATSIERRGSDPLCEYDPETGFAVNQSTVDELRWYTYLNPEELDAGLLQSDHDD